MRVHPHLHNVEKIPSNIKRKIKIARENKWPHINKTLRSKTLTKNKLKLVAGGIR